MTAPAACAACNDDERCVSTAIDAPEAASADPCISQRVNDTFRKAQTERRATQLLTPGETSSPSQLDQPSRRGCGAVPSRWASTVVPGASGAKKRPRGSRRSPFTKIARSTLAPLATRCYIPARYRDTRGNWRPSHAQVQRSTVYATNDRINRFQAPGSGRATVRA